MSSLAVCLLSALVVRSGGADMILIADRLEGHGKDSAIRLNIQCQYADLIPLGIFAYPLIVEIGNHILGSPFIRVRKLGRNTRMVVDNTAAQHFT